MASDDQRNVQKRLEYIKANIDAVSAAEMVDEATKNETENPVQNETAAEQPKSETSSRLDEGDKMVEDDQVQSNAKVEKGKGEES